MPFEKGKYTFRRYQADVGETRANVFELEVHWTLGSARRGEKSRRRLVPLASVFEPAPGDDSVGGR